MKDLPWTPDFDHWPITHDVTGLAHDGEALTIIWSDGRASQHHVWLLRENSPDEGTIHPKAREMAITPLDIPADLAIRGAEKSESGAVIVAFSDGLTSAFHPGWLRGTAWFGDPEPTRPVMWRAADLAEPPSFDGPTALDDPAVFLAWLTALRDYGVARLRGLPVRDGMLAEVVSRIGPVRESHFGAFFTLEIKDDPDSLAYTPVGLPNHMDMPTRETPHGLQFLFTRENTTTGGDGIYADGYRIAEDMRIEDPENYWSLANDVWEYANRSKVTDYRGKGPVVETDAQGRICGIRFSTWLRRPMVAPLPVQARAYRAYRAFCARAQDPAYELRMRYEPGDLLAFDNRRALHGRGGYDEKGGVRFIEGVYSDRDDLYARIRILQRAARRAQTV